jgi:hypothetical protein
MSSDKENAATFSTSPTATELLQAWWQAGETAQAEPFLIRLLTDHAIPIIKAVSAYRLRKEVAQPSDAEDICQEVSLQLVARLSYLRATGAAPLRGDFASYTAAVAHQVCSLYRRKQFPARARLKDQLRYVLTHQPGFALWEAAPKIWISGFVVWREQGKSAVLPTQILELQENKERLGWHWAGTKPLALAELLTAIFKHLRGPVEFAALVNLVAAVLGIKAAGPLETALDEVSTQLSPRTDLADQVEQRLYLQRLWQEIVQLPLPQRLALLLNLRDAQERGLVVLLVELRITSLHQLAEVLGLTPLEFAELWQALPLDDTRVATLLNLTRQQVINLRSSARRQLASRMRAVFGEK